MTVRTRFAPSPTGVLHLGSVRTALFCWLFARRHGGEFVVRIEDTDRERSTTENVDAILDGLQWLGLAADEGPYFQSERLDRYQSELENWLAEGKAYHCYCTKEELESLRRSQMDAGERVRYDGRCRLGGQQRPGIDPVVRFKNPQDGLVVVNDLVRGRVVFENAQLDDLIIARSDGSPTYNFTVVVDDHDMRISHVIRGDDHLNNTPRQMNMLAALGVAPPEYAHLPMILGSDGAKLSKRHGAVDVRQYREQGFLAVALLNYLVRLGWSHGDQEVFSVEEMVQLFDIADVNQSAAAFDPEKLRWINQQHIIRTPPEELAVELSPFLVGQGYDLSNGPKPVDIAEGLRERAQTLVEMAASVRYCYEDFTSIDPQFVKKHLRPVVLQPMRTLLERLDALDGWATEGIAKVIQQVAEDHELKLGKLGQPVRVAVTGGPVSPPIDVTLRLVGKERAVRRLQQAVRLIEARALG